MTADVPDLLTGLATTRAIRRIAPDPVPDADLATILWHATRAPSGSNRQPVRYLVLRDGGVAADAKALLARGFREAWDAKQDASGYRSGSALEPTSRKGRQKAAMEHMIDHFEEVPVVVLVCLERYRDPNPYEGSSVYPAAQNLLLAARALGYGGVLTMWHQGVEDELRDLTGIPDHVAISATIPLGRPLGRHGPVSRRPLAEVVYDASWDTPAPWALDPSDPVSDTESDIGRGDDIG